MYVQVYSPIENYLICSYPYKIPNYRLMRFSKLLFQIILPPEFDTLGDFV